MKRGFFVPKSVGSDYVPNERDSQGARIWDTASQEVGLGKQAALHSINQQYSQTINNAYSNYLMANRGIRGSQMGQGYKEAYMQMTEQNLMAGIAETNLNAGQLRQQIGGQAQEQLGGIQDMMTNEIANFDRVSTTMNDYLGYVKTLSGSLDASKTYLTADQQSLSLDDMYDTLFAAQPQGYVDAEGNLGMSYIEWINSKMKDSQSDRNWSQWLFSQGGFDKFRDATKKGINK